MALFHYSHRKAVKLVLGIVFLLILFPVLFAVFFAAQDEISVGASAGISTCDEFYVRDESELSRCTSTYNISLGNTGTRQQELITLELGSVPENRRISWNTLDIVATNREATGPRIRNRQLGETLVFEIEELQPNRLVEINISSQGVESAEMMENITLTVLAEGSIIETSPRLTVSLRFLRNLAGMFGF